MTKQRARREAKRHRGVRLLRLTDGRNVARWTDPLDRRQRQESLDRLGLTHDDARRRWATEKAKTLAAMRERLSLGAVHAVRVPPAEAASAHLKNYANAGTREAKRIVLDNFVAWCRGAGVPTMDALTSAHVKSWRDHLRHGTLAPSTQNRWLGVLASFLRECAEEPSRVPLLSTDAIRSACKRVDQPAREIEFLRPEQIRVVLQAAMAHDAVARRKQHRISEIILVLLLSGMRREEAVGLRWQEVDLVANEIRLPPQRTKGARKGRRITFDVAPTLATLLARLKREADEGCDRVFPNWSAVSLNHRMGQLAKMGAPRFSAHTLRRSCGTLLVCSPSVFGAASIFLSAQRLGHGVAISEKHYLGHLSGLPADAKTIEDAGGFRELAEKIANGGAAIGGSATP